MAPPGFIVAHNGARIFGGGEKWTLLLLRGLRERGHRVLLLAREEVAGRAPEHDVPARAFGLGGDVMLTDALRFAWRLRRAGPDALLLSTFKKTWLGGMGAALAGVPRVVSRIGLSTDLPDRHWKYGVAYRRWIDVTSANADAIRTDFLAAAPELDPRRVVTIYDGIRRPERRRPPGSLRRELGLARDAPVIGAVARLARQKRFDRLLRVANRLPDDVHVVLAGDGPRREELESLAGALELRDRVHLLGFRDDVGDVLDALDIFVLTSDREGMSNAMLEAMATGVPVVSTPVSGADEALDPLEDGSRPGIVIEPPVEPYADALAELLDDRERREAMGAAGRRRVEERFGFDRMVRSWERLLVGSLDPPPHEGPSPLDGPDGR